MTFQAKQSHNAGPVESRVFIQQPLHSFSEMGKIARLPCGAKSLMTKFSALLSKRENAVLLG